MGQQVTISVQTVVAFIGIAITFGISLAQVVYRSGQLDARVKTIEKWQDSCNIENLRTRIESVEEWRKAVRGDMHEVSEELRLLAGEVKQLRTIIEERTDRRDMGRRAGIGDQV